MADYAFAKEDGKDIEEIKGHGRKATNGTAEGEGTAVIRPKTT